MAHNIIHADDPATLVTTTAPQLQKVQDLPANTMPSQRNIDCQEVTYGDGTKGCTITTAFGTADIEGSGGFTFGNEAKPVQIDSFNGLMPVPGQGMVLGIGTSGTVYGEHLYVYTDIYNHLTPVVNFKNKVEYQLTGAPSYTVKNPGGATMEFNVRNSLAYSANSAWMIVDGIGGSFYRFNLATFDMLPFAPSLEIGPNYVRHAAQTAISDDGRFAAIAYNTGSTGPYYVRVYDLSTCKGTIANQVNGGPLPCSFQDYRPYLSSRLPGFYGAYNLRFIGDGSLTFYAVYNYKSSTNFSVAQYVLSPTAAPFHAIDYMALGDSYISGQGEFLYETGTDTDNNSCHISPLAYPFIIGSDLFSVYHSVACSGATTNDIIASPVNYTAQAKKVNNIDTISIQDNFLPGYIPQLSFIKQYHPKVVTLSIGGNDIHFADIIKSCVASLSSATCYGSTNERAELVKEIDNVYSTLQDTYSAILKADPGVQLYVIGYPQIAVEGNCADNVHLNADEIQFSQQLIAYLDEVIERAANSTGSRYVDTQNALAGNRLCETKIDVAVNGLTAGNDALGVIGAESYHPNIKGHQMLAENILEQTDNFKQIMPAADNTVAKPTPSDPLAQELTRHVNYNATSIPVPKPEDTLIPDIITHGSAQDVSINGAQDGLQPNGSYTAVLHSDPITLGSFVADASGNLNFAFTVPSIDPGFHTLHVYGLDMAGEPVDIYKQIYVAASLTDYNGDGIPNKAEQCLIIPPSGQDVDKDGIDDACDPLIGEPSAEPVPSQDQNQQTPNSTSQTDQSTPPTHTNALTASALQTTSNPAESQGSDTTFAPANSTGTVLGDTAPANSQAQQSNRVDQLLNQKQESTAGASKAIQILMAALGVIAIVCFVWLIRRFAFRK